MTPPRLLAVFMALSLIGTPLQVFASEDIPIPSDTTSTISIVLPVQESASSTVLTPTPIIDLTSTTTHTETLGTYVTSTESITTPTTTPSTVPTTSSPIEFDISLNTPPTSSTTSTICLAIIAPYPNEGPEWIAFYGLTASSAHRLLQWSIYDAQSSLVKIVTSTPLLWDEPSQTLRFQLRSARLNNDGDTVTLKNQLGEIHDTFAYTEVERDQRWFRERCDAPWHIVPEPIVQYVNDSPTPTSPSSTASSNTDTSPSIPIAPTMNVANEALPPSTPIIIEEERSVSPAVAVDPEPPAIISEEKPPVSVIAVASIATPAVATAASTPVNKKPSKTSKSTSAKSNTPATTKQKHPSSKTSASPAKNPSAAKPKSTSSTPKKKAAKTPIPSLSMSTILEQPTEYQGVRVRITGTVASTQKLVGTHKFVLLNSDGKGLLVHAKTTAPTPERGQYIQLTGVITWNDEGVWLKQQTQDSWEALERETEDPSPEFALHTATLDAPGQEDAWSHIEVEGKITEVQSGSFDIETEDGVPLRIRVPKLLGYRAGRLESRDTVRVRGLLDTRGTEPVLLPQVIEDIQILARAPLPAPKDTRPAQAPWLPVGIIAGTLAGSETLRRAKTWYKKQQEERAFAAFLQTNPQNTH